MVSLVLYRLVTNSLELLQQSFGKIWLMVSQRRRFAKKSHGAANVTRTLRPETSEKESSTRVSQTTHSVTTYSETVGNDTKPEVGRIKESPEHTAIKGKVIE
jgi:hypothetical protein